MKLLVSLCILFAVCIGLTIGEYVHKIPEDWPFPYPMLCREFKRVNNITHCCAGRQDDCYMESIYMDSPVRCYCDQHCNWENGGSDCCMDHYYECQYEKSETTTRRQTTTTPTPATTTRVQPQLQQLRHSAPGTEGRPGFCEVFVRLNNLKSCCDGDPSECYMNHFNTKCYCHPGCTEQNNCCLDYKAYCKKFTF